MSEILVSDSWSEQCYGCVSDFYGYLVLASGAWVAHPGVRQADCRQSCVIDFDLFYSLIIRFVVSFSWGFHNGM